MGTAAWPALPQLSERLAGAVTAPGRTSQTRSVGEYVRSL